MEQKLVIGVDFGTLSARAALVRVQDGICIAEAEHAYAHGVMDTCLPCGRTLPPDFALQHPQDYADALEETIRAVMAKSGAAAQGAFAGQYKGTPKHDDAALGYFHRKTEGAFVMKAPNSV